MPYNAPNDAIVSVLRRLGVDPESRISAQDQDPEYTACRAEEVSQYFDLYCRGELEPAERAVLCCFMLEGLNDFVQSGSTHVLQNEIIDRLLSTEEHAEEFAHWMDESDPDPETQWPISAVLRERLRARDVPVRT